MDVEKAIRTAVKTGKVVLGGKETLRAIRKKELKLAILAGNCPSALKNNLKRYAELSKTPVYEFEGSSLALGSICGKPFIVSLLGIFEAGDSEVLELGRGIVK